MSESTSIRIGDRVRSFDFESRRDCYVEGVVDAIARDVSNGLGRFDAYEVRCERRVFAGEEVEPEARTFYPPINGTPTLGGVCRFVEKVGG